jgi:predicted lipid-binding transport protein (Tim44 family)
MESKMNLERQNPSNTVVAPMPDAVDRGVSQLIGGLMLFGLAWGGLALGYASAAMQALGTAMMGVTGFALTGSGVWNLVTKKSR